MNDTSVHSETAVIDLPPDFTRILETAFEKTAGEYNANAVPDINNARTAVFTSKWSGEEYPFNEGELQAKIAEDFARLSGLGYDTFIVNTGTRYGMLALRELAALKKETPFRLIRSKVRGEFFEEPKPCVKTAALMYVCDSFVYADNVSHYDDIILSRSSYVSDEIGLAAN
jgi:hypothetical protein